LACGGQPSVTPLSFTPEGPAACRFTVGFREFRAAMPDLVGDCTENERIEPNGDVAQRTTNGLLVWRRGDGYIAFTDGGQTWIQGPNGIEVRPNGQFLPWETLPTAAPSGTAQRTPEASPKPGLTAAPTRPAATPGAKPAATRPAATAAAKPAATAPPKPAAPPPKPASPPSKPTAPPKKP
jgi:hypothetical protein